MKKQAREAVHQHLDRERQRIQMKLASNIYAMRKLVDEQTLLKRERAVVHALMRLLESPAELGRTTK